MPRALVTGATGLVGSHIALRLRELEWDVHALVRSVEGAAWLQSAGVGLIEGDVTHAESLAGAARGCDAIFHAAALVSSSSDAAAYQRSNVGGTDNAIAVAQRSGARLVHVSSVAVYGLSGRYRGDSRPTTESSPIAAAEDNNIYGAGKVRSEKQVLDAAERGLWATVVRPSVVYGERDRQFIPRVARAFTRFFAPVIGAGDASLAIIHAGNVADVCILAASNDASTGRAYNATGERPVTYLEFIALAELGMQRRIRRLSLPRTAAYAVARFMELGVRSGVLPYVPADARSSIDFLTRGNPFSAERAHRELKWYPRYDPREQIPAAFQWAVSRQG